MSQVEGGEMVILDVAWHPTCEFLTITGSDGYLKVYLLSDSPFPFLFRSHGASSIDRCF
jgi:hypothetical protein